ncbi:MAG TPA: hypothetical protein VLW53_03940, partial [Candidatus Eisenbacteria bacterium]|nr:hypothetical protein [Candidatus Eisenbacteria bacterium]
MAAGVGRVIPAILVGGSERRPSLGVAAAVAVEAAAITGAATLLVEAGEGARRRGSTLLAAPGSRRVEGALRDAGLRGSARGYLCHLAIEEGEELPSRVAGAISASQAELAVVHLAGRHWVPALESVDLAAAGGCLLVSLPGERSLAALAVDELSRRGLPARVITQPPAPLGARRALAGVRAG